MDNSQNTKRIAKNTLMLYIRMFITMLISLYTSRVILASLGVEDYGIYNVVGGIVGMFGVITSTLNTAINRFMTFELGSGDEEKLKRVFSTSITIQIILSLIVVALAETVGLWYLNNVMVIPPERMTAARWCYQFSIITCVIGLIAVPFNSAVIAHEKMSVFAFFGILGCLITLLIAFLIQHNPFDRLVFYGLLLMLVSLLNQQIYMWYCIKHFKEARFKFTVDREMLGQMFGFAGWNFIGAGSGILRDYGGNLLINFYFGPVVNAARGISNSVNNAITQFSTNFTTALKPQITKSYASKDYDYMFKLMYKGAKLSVYMMLFISAPVLLNTQFVLGVWLREVPAHAALFTQLTLVYTMLVISSGPLITSMLATGNIKNYQILVGGINLLNIPISLLLLHFGCIPETIAIVSIVLEHFCMIARLYMLKGMINLNPWSYFKQVYLNIISITAVGILIPLLCHLLIPDGWGNFLITSAVCLITMGTAMLFVGCDESERQFIFDAAKKFANKFKKSND